MADASRVLLSYAPAREWVARELDADSYRGYLRRTRGGPVAPGDEWEVFAARGCSTPRDVVLRVERVEGGDELGSRTTIDYRPRSEGRTAGFDDRERTDT